jgi:hypothetical protein
MIRDRDAGGLELAESSGDRTIAHVMAWIIVEVNQKQPGMMSASDHDQFMIPS